MSTFYGNSNLPVNTIFTFDKIYPNRKTMDDSAQTDGVYLNRYVLIEYGEEEYESNYSLDQLNYNNKTYDATAWMKQYDDTQQKYVYICIAILNSFTDELTTLRDEIKELMGDESAPAEGTLNWIVDTFGTKEDTIEDGTILGTINQVNQDLAEDNYVPDIIINAESSLTVGSKPTVEKSGDKKNPTFKFNFPVAQGLQIDKIFDSEPIDLPASEDEVGLSGTWTSNDTTILYTCLETEPGVYKWVMSGTFGASIMWEEF